jgi:hypothetical protein
MTKNAARREKFRKLGEALSALDLAWQERRGELQAPKPRAVEDKKLSSRMFGPVMKTIQQRRP